MSDMSKIKPINTKILFQFLEDLDNTHFNSKTKGGLFVVENNENQVNKNRWGKVIAVGPMVDGLVEPEEYVLIEALGWTNGMTMDDGQDAERFWFTDVEKVICVSEEKPELF